VCIKIGVVFPKKYNKSNIVGLLAEYNFSFSPINNVYVLSQLSEEYEFLEATESSCECYSGIGSFELYTKDNEELLAQLEDETLAEIMRKEDIQKKQQFKEDAQKWEKFITKLVIDYNVEKFGLLMHFYNESIHNEKFKILDKTFIRFDEVNTEYIMKMKPDIIYYFKQA